MMKVLMVLVASLVLTLACAQPDPTATPTPTPTPTPTLTPTPTPDPRMTVQEYADNCKRIGDAFDSIEVPEGDGASAMESAERLLAEAQTWKPPEELEQYHALVTKALQMIIFSLKDAGFVQYFQELERPADTRNEAKIQELSAKIDAAMGDLDSQLDELADEAERIEAAIPADIRDLLFDVGCL